MEHDDHEGDEDKKINGESLGRQISSSKAHELSSASSPSVFDRLYGTRTQANVSLKQVLISSHLSHVIIVVY